LTASGPNVGEEVRHAAGCPQPHIATTKTNRRCWPEFGKIEDVHRFADPARLCSWARLTPRHHESDTVVRRGHITKQGPKLERWAAVEAIGRHRATSKISLDGTRIESRRGKNIAKIAVAPKLLTLLYYELRDGQIRALAPRTAP
jgi:Transposase IS116/IS110/IS902 family